MMTDGPIPRLDPERLREERQGVDLGETETGFAGGARADEAKATSQAGTGGEPTAGMTPPAR